MFSTILAVFFLAAFLSAENLISTIVGGLVAVGATQWIKNASGLGGAGATVLALVVSVIVAVIAFSVSMLVSGEFSWAALPAGAAQIFTLATLAYRLLVPTTGSD